MLNKNKMSLKTITTNLLLISMLAGCADMHTSNYKEIQDQSKETQLDFDRLKNNTITSINSGSTLDEIYVHLEPVKIAAHEANKLPVYLPTNISIYEGLPITEKKLVQLLQKDYGLTVKFSRLERKVDEEDSSDLENVANNGTDGITTKADGSVDISGLTANKNSDEYDGPSKSNSDNNSLTKSTNKYETTLEDLFKDSSTADEADLRIQKIDYDGNLYGFFDWLAAERGLSWKYDNDQDAFVLFDLDTQIFEIVDNTHLFVYESTIDTSNNSESSSSDGSGSNVSNTSQRASYSEESDHWEDIQSLFNQMLSKKGSASYDLKNGLVAITDTQQVLNKVAKIVKYLNESSESQVVLNLTFIKLSLEESSEIGVNLSATDLVTGAVSGSASLGSDLAVMPNLFNMSFTKTGVDAVIGSLGSLGTISYRFDSPIFTLNNQVTQYQSADEERYISLVTRETDENGAVILTPETDVNKTGITSIWKNRIIGDRVLIDGKISLIENLSMKEIENMSNVVLPKNSMDTHTIKTILKNGDTRIVSIKEVTRNVAESSGPFGSNSFIFGGSEKTNKQREISLILATPFVIK